MSETTVMVPSYKALSRNVNDNSDVVSKIEAKRIESLNQESLKLKTKTRKMIKKIIRRATKKYTSGAIEIFESENFKSGFPFWEKSILLNTSQENIIKEVLKEEVPIIRLSDKKYGTYDKFSCLTIFASAEAFGLWLKTDQATKYL